MIPPTDSAFRNEIFTILLSESHWLRAKLLTALGGAAQQGFLGRCLWVSCPQIRFMNT
jgi:hypothetical protein